MSEHLEELGRETCACASLAVFLVSSFLWYSGRKCARDDGGE